MEICGKWIIFFKKSLLVRNNYLSLHQNKPVRAWMGNKINFVERDLRPVVRPVLKGRFRNVTVCVVKLRNFEPDTAVMQQRRLRKVDYIYICRLTVPLIYNKVVLFSDSTHFVYMDRRECNVRWIVCIYIT